MNEYKLCQNTARPNINVAYSMSWLILIQLKYVFAVINNVTTILVIVSCVCYRFAFQDTVKPPPVALHHRPLQKDFWTEPEHQQNT